MTRGDMACPKCKRIGFLFKSVWHKDQPNTTMKCFRCGEWNTLAAWIEETKQYLLKKYHWALGKAAA